MLLLAQSSELGLFLWSEQFNFFRCQGCSSRHFSRRIPGLAGLISYRCGTGLQSGIRWEGHPALCKHLRVHTHVHTDA